jgi:hypothetical protein
MGGHSSVSDPESAWGFMVLASVNPEGEVRNDLGLVDEEPDVFDGEAHAETFRGERE